MQKHSSEKMQEYIVQVPQFSTFDGQKFYKVEKDEDEDLNELYGEEEPDQDKSQELVNKAKNLYQNLIMQFLNAHQLNDQSLKKFLLQIPKFIVPNMSNPLFLSDFLTSCLDHDR